LGTAKLIAGFVDREKRLPIRTAPYRDVKWCVHHDRRLEPEHPFHDDVISHEIGHRRARIPGEPHYPIDVVDPINKEPPRRCSLDEINHLAPWRAPVLKFNDFIARKRRDGILKAQSELGLNHPSWYRHAVYDIGHCDGID
jgi:hypothetical protein